MTKRLVLTIFSAVLIAVSAGCESRGSKGDIGTGAQLSYEDIQKRAEEFVPSIGKSGGEVVLSTISDPKSFNPITSTETSTSYFTNLMYEGLLTQNGVTLEMEPNIAERYEISEDGLTWTFFIRDGVEWSDGVPLSAYDVEFTFNDLIYNKDIVPNSSRDIFTLSGKQIGVKALDSTRVRFTLPFTFAPFLNSLTQEILPKHKHAKAVAAKTFSTSLSIRTPPADMVVNGPFLLDSYISSQKVIFKKNPKYWKKDGEGNNLPYLDRLVYTLVSDQNAELLKFLQGETDYFAAKGEDFPELKRAETPDNFTVYRLGPMTGTSFIVFNQNLRVNPQTNKTYVPPAKLEWFRNDNFRKAIAHVIDKENMVAIAMNGLGYPQWSPKTPAEGYFYNPNVVKYNYDPKIAREILVSEGFKVPAPNSGEFLTDKDGNIVEFSLVTNSGNNVRIKIAEIIRKDLQDLGIKVHFQILEFNSIIQKIDNPPFDFDCVLLGLTGGPEPHFGRNVWHSSGQLHMWYPRQSEPSTPWEARIDTIFDLGVKEMDRAKRKELYDEWQVIAAQKAPFIYTVLAERIECVWNKFENVNPNMNSGLLHNLEYWYVK
ncbi:MAG: ABC transporter substrate-binding protein [Chitinispirillales bacterium]|jgi:peptide/nickel transport system substrate-binding protein|nr:ABC transporter substrate-binding protein [Chitinispirillales bacterium]